MDYENKKLSIHLKTNFNNNKISKNLLYNVTDINDQLKLKSILEDLKLTITDIWKEENLINLLMPLSIKLKFKHASLNNLDELRNTFQKISIFFLVLGFILEYSFINLLHSLLSRALRYYRL